MEADKFALHQACRDGNLTVAQNLLEANPKLVRLVDDDDRLPIHWAVSYNHRPIVELLITNTKDFDPDVTDSLGWTPLMMACSRPNSDSTDMVSLLISKGADVNAKTTNLQTPLHFAVSKLNLPIIQMLLEHKASARFRDKRGQLALHRAAAKGNVPVLKWLIKAGSPINTQDLDGLTPLHHAVSEGHGDAALYLVAEAGADTSKRDSEGKLAVDTAPDGKVRDFIIEGARRAGVDIETDVKSSTMEEEEG